MGTKIPINQLAGKIRPLIPFTSDREVGWGPTPWFFLERGLVKIRWSPRAPLFEDDLTITWCWVACQRKYLVIGQKNPAGNRVHGCR